MYFNIKIFYDTYLPSTFTIIYLVNSIFRKCHYNLTFELLLLNIKTTVLTRNSLLHPLTITNEIIDLLGITKLVCWVVIFTDTLSIFVIKISAVNGRLHICQKN